MIKTFLRNRRGNVSLFAVIVIPVLLGIVGLGVEYGFGLLQRVENQRVADLAAFAAATAYNADSSVSITTIADNVAGLNGVALSAVTATLVTSPTGSGKQAVQVTVTSHDPLHFSRLLGSGPLLTVGAIAYAELKAGAPPCIIALQNGGQGLTVSGGAQLTANQCAVSSNAAVTVSKCSSTSKPAITTETVNYNTSSTPDTSCGKIVAPSGKSLHLINTTTSDPLARNSGVTDAVARISSTVATLQSPSAPSVSSGTDINFASNVSATQSQLSSGGCSGTLNKSTWTVTCSGSSVNFGTITLNGGITVNFNVNGSASTTYNFSGMIDGTSGTALSFGPGTYNIAGGIAASGSLLMAFGAGTFNIGTISSSSACSGSGWSICVVGSARITFGGPSSFVLAGGIYQSASGMPPSAALTMGSGSTNSYNIGRSATGYSLNNNNGATIFGDATGSTDLFQMAGGVTTTGGTCVAIGSAAQHDIDGSMDAAGGLYLGSGVYTVNGYVALGNNKGGNVPNCPTSGTTTGLNGIGVTFVISGSATTTCDSLASAFCLGAGYSMVTLTAPTSSSTFGSSTAGIAVIGPSASSTNASAAAVFKSGASNTRISGTFYFPNGPIEMSGAAALQDTTDANACLELIGSYIALNGGSALGSSCISGSGSSSAVALVQ